MIFTDWRNLYLPVMARGVTYGVVELALQVIVKYSRILQESC